MLAGVVAGGASCDGSSGRQWQAKGFGGQLRCQLQLLPNIRGTATVAHEKLWEEVGTRERRGEGLSSSSSSGVVESLARTAGMESLGVELRFCRGCGQRGRRKEFN